MRRSKFVGVGLALTVAMTVASCASSDRGSTTSSGTSSAGGSASSPSGSSAAPGSTAGSATGSGSASTSAGGGPSDPNGTFIFGAAGAPSMFDALYATDGETFRVTRQMTEGLIQFKPGTADIEPALAQSWTQSKDGLAWTFKVRQGVKFTDGTALDAAAICYNYDRMYSQTGAGASLAQYWSDNFGGFKGQKDDAGKAVPSLYKSCVAKDAATAVVTITRATSKFPAILGLPSFSIQSPAALKQYNANAVKADGDSFDYPAYALSHPTGTGPFKFSKYDKTNNTVELVRNDDYWGDKAKVAKLIFQIIPDETARKQALEAKTIDGYDLPNPADWDGLKADGFNVEVRPAFNVLYLGIDQKNNPKLADLKVRQAIAYALNRKQFVESQLPEGAEVALEFYPKTVDGWTPDVQKYDYDPTKAKALLAEAGATNLTLNFWWPTEVSRPYMPDPKSVFTAFKADLQAVGIKINETSKPWNGGYLDGVDATKPDLFLLGWTGDYNTPDNFLGSFFSDPKNRFYTAASSWGTTFSNELAAADSEPDKTKRDAMYVALNKKIMSQYLPAIPISHSPPAIVVAGNIKGLVPSPLTDERFASVYKG